jgi:hypothetical protein
VGLVTGICTIFRRGQQYGVLWYVKEQGERENSSGIWIRF